MSAALPLPPRPARDPGSARSARNARTALLAALLVAAMAGLAFASAPLYRLFCAATGIGGTTQRASAAPGAVAGAMIGVRFDANIDPALPWRFEPAQRTVRVRPGESIQVAYRATNLVARPTLGTASFNVTPASAGKYFSKIECFCFTEQRLAGGQRAVLPVTFFVDPAIRGDPATRGIDEITLSYTFYPVETGPGAS